MKKIIPKSSLKNWALERFQSHRHSMEFMSCAKNCHDRAVIAIVALMEVDPGIRYQGMNEDELTRIFDRYYRGESSRTRRGNGTGLGSPV